MIKYVRLIFIISFRLILMSNFPIFGCGLPSKPRATEPSMFEILSWPGEKELSESRFE